jgi:hypothetical protein
MDECTEYPIPLLTSPKAILLAKSEMHTIYFRDELENQVCQRHKFLPN